MNQKHPFKTLPLYANLLGITVIGNFKMIRGDVGSDVKKVFHDSMGIVMSMSLYWDNYSELLLNGQINKVIL